MLNLLLLYHQSIGERENTTADDRQQRAQAATLRSLAQTQIPPSVIEDGKSCGGASSGAASGRFVTKATVAVGTGYGGCDQSIRLQSSGDQPREQQLQQWPITFEQEMAGGD